MSESGKIHEYTIKNVRYIPSYIDTLISVNQLWEEQQIDAVFSNVKSIIFPDGVRVPIKWGNGVYGVKTVINPKLRHELGDISTPVGARALAAHNAHAHSHIKKLPPNALAQLMHNRLHLSLEKIKRLPHNTTDAPQTLALATHIDCEACARSNAKSLHHPNIGYTPS